jgi:Putative adhesin
MIAPRLSTAFFALIFASTLCYAAEPEFNRSLTVNGNLTFSVCSTSGSIHVAGVDGNKVEIDAKLHNSTWHTTGTSGDMKEIVANPPIHQTGNEIKVGDADTCGGAKAHNIDIDYEITIPKNSTVEAVTGPGSVKVENIAGFVHAAAGGGSIVATNIGPDSKLATRAGTIDITGAHGDLMAVTESGNLTVGNSTVTEARLHTGSGSITTTNLHGGMRINSGTGNLTIGGSPNSDWKLETGSGNIQIHIDQGAKFLLDVETGSGTIDSIFASPLSGHITNGVMKGPVNGGGPTVQVYTGSGNIAFI